MAARTVTAGVDFVAGTLLADVVRGTLITHDAVRGWVAVLPATAVSPIEHPT